MIAVGRSSPVQAFAPGHRHILSRCVCCSQSADRGECPLKTIEISISLEKVKLLTFLKSGMLIQGVESQADTQKEIKTCLLLLLLHNHLLIPV